MDTVGNKLMDQDNINFITKYCKGSLAEWYTIIRDQVTTYEDFVQAFETQYWNLHKVRDSLDIGKYVYGQQTKEKYVIQQVAKVKHQSPQLNEA